MKVRIPSWRTSPADISGRVGFIPLWLLIVYGLLFAWGLYYMYTYWGGLGPGRLY